LLNNKRKFCRNWKIQLKTKSLTIDFLTQQLNNAKKIETHQPLINLLDI
jgi:hypothetical protein